MTRQRPTVLEDFMLIIYVQRLAGLFPRPASCNPVDPPHKRLPRQRATHGMREHTARLTTDIARKTKLSNNSARRCADGSAAWPQRARRHARVLAKPPWTCFVQAHSGPLIQKQMNDRRKNVKSKTATSASKNVNLGPALERFQRRGSGTSSP